jgi:predicted RNase H-like HicB family nuclease
MPESRARDQAGKRKPWAKRHSDGYGLQIDGANAHAYDRRAMSEVIFEVREDTADGGFAASALGLGIHTEADTVEDLRANIRDAVDCYFHDTAET